ncbi:MAG: DUF1579 family protein [bacterium]
MKRIAVVLSLLLLVFAVSVQTQNQKPTPPPEMKNFDIYIGDWTLEGEYHESPLGAAEKYTGKITIRWILDGFFMEWKTVHKGEKSGNIESIMFEWYDAATKTYRYQIFENDGSTSSGTETVKGNQRTWLSEITYRGTKYQIRAAAIFAPDGMSWNGKGEISADGKTWKLIFEDKVTKVKPAAQK